MHDLFQTQAERALWEDIVKQVQKSEAEKERRIVALSLEIQTLKDNADMVSIWL